MASSGGARKGASPKSKGKHGGARKGAGPKHKDTKKTGVMVSMSEETKKAMKLLGNGNLSKGVEIGAKIYAESSADRFFARSPVSEQCKLLFELLREDPNLVKSEEFQNRMGDVVERIESLGIEVNYEDAVIDGVIEVKGDCYIV